jgi:8-oxo-dGTP pyrophosphatase MutT (NUDIX family)
MFRNPWKTLGSRPIYATPWFSVRCDEVVRPDGARGTYSVVHSERLAVGVVPLWDDGTVTLVGQWRYPLAEYSWELPEGGGDPARAPIEAARMELREEAGIEARAWVDLGRCHTSNCWTDEIGHLFLARDLVQGTPEPGGDEELVTRRLPLTEAIAMAADGRITDAISIVALFRAAEFLAGRLAAPTVDPGK